VERPNWGTKKKKNLVIVPLTIIIGREAIGKESEEGSFGNIPKRKKDTRRKKIKDKVTTAKRGGKGVAIRG